MCRYNHLHSAATIAANIRTTKSYLIHLQLKICHITHVLYSIPNDAQHKIQFNFLEMPISQSFLPVKRPYALWKV